MIHLVAVKIGSHKWVVIPSDVRDVREKIYLTVKKKIEDKLAEKKPDKLIKKMRESGREWVEDGMKKESGSEEV